MKHILFNVDIYNALCKFKISAGGTYEYLQSTCNRKRTAVAKGRNILFIPL